MAQRGSAFNDFSCIDSSDIYAKEIEKEFFPEDAVNVPRNEEDATKCCNAGTRSARRGRVIVRVLAEEPENLTGLQEW